MRADNPTRQYVVELIGESRELYIVEAENEDDARANWSTGWLQLTESIGMDVQSVRLDDDQEDS